MKLFLDSIGCRLNQSEMETLARQLVAAGHEIVADSAVADRVVINTCAVTAEAARDARTMTRRIHRQNANTPIVLTGCYATIAPQETAVLPGVTTVVPNQRKSQLIHLLDPQVELPTFDHEPLQRDIRSGAFGHTRAFVKVQDGCDNKCTFCVTTIARGEGQSRHLGDVVAEIQTFAAIGYQEAVLTGVHLGSYGHDLGNKHGLRELLTAVLTHTDIPRLRLSSLEPWDIAPDFFALWQNPRLLPHLHLPLQSGSDKILRRMARRTSRTNFRQLADAAKSAIPHLNLTTDIIVGFPGETETDFCQSLEYVQEIGFSRLHVFSYSPRPGTTAAAMPQQVAGPTKKERTRRFIEVGQALGQAFHQKYVGQTMPVLWESVVGADAAGLRWHGYTNNYIRVAAYGPADLRNRITPVEMEQAQVEGLVGEIVESNQ